MPGTASPTLEDPSVPHVIVISYALVEEAGGPGPVTLGFVEGLARLGVPVTLIAADNLPGRWLTDAERARRLGYRYVQLPRDHMLGHARALLRATKDEVARVKRPFVLWSCGLWGAPSMVMGYLARTRGWPFVVRPDGCLGTAALHRKRSKKLLYYYALESHLLHRAAAVHCMSERERLELPASLQARAFVVPGGVVLPDAPLPALEPSARPLVGVLARVHPIKRHERVLEAAEALLARGHELEVEFAGGLVDPAYERQLRQQVERSALLSGRVRFLGHVPHEQIASVVQRWRVAMLLSEQENFGHSVVTTAAMGIPTLVSTGVGVGPQLAAAGAGTVVEQHRVADVLESFLTAPPEAHREPCLAFARQFGWDACARGLLHALQDVALAGPARSS
jgi:glycosyltransferase involved in cell wall biosynthesis